MSTVLLLGVGPEEAFVIHKAIGANSDLRARSVDREGFEETLRREADSVDLVVVGPRFERGIEAVQRVGRHDRSLASILLCDPGDVQALKGSLRLAPGIGRHVRSLALDDPELASAVRKQVRGTARRRRLGRTLEAMTTRLDRSDVPSRFVPSQPLVSRLMDELPVGVLIVDPRGRVAASNLAAETLLALPEERLIGRQVADLLSPSDAVDEDRPWKPTKDDETGPIDVTVGGDRILAVRSARSDTSSAETATILVLEDVTERRRIEDRLSGGAKLEAVGHLAGGIAHHFNNLLTVILGRVEELETSERASPAVRDIREAAERAAELTRQLLAFAERQLVRPAVLRLSELVTSLLPLLEQSLGDDIRVETRLSGDEEPVQVDRGQFEQVLVSLAFNARDAMPDGGVLTLEVAECSEAYGPPDRAESRPVRYVRMVVRDTGIGMDEETLSRAFEPFFTTKEVGQGTGLGLAAAHGIVRRHGGRIHVESEPSRGTTVCIDLPSAKAQRDGADEDLC